MKWDLCVVDRLLTKNESRFDRPESGGFDCTENLTISDIWGGWQWLVSWPGDWILSQEPLRSFFELDGPIGPIGAGGSMVLGYLPFTMGSVATVRLPQSGHSSMAHFYCYFIRF
jgi:hypothetical protein